jgi:hypothetical protein
MSSPIDNLVIQKAKKKEGFYICPIGCNTMKYPFSLYFDKVTILQLRETSGSLVFKCKPMCKYMDELNDRIIDIVRENSGSWFNTSIDEDFIEEYYISTLQYDKKRGETIRLKVKNIDELDQEVLETNGTLHVTFKNLKFYKQKFFPEFEFVSFNPLLDTSTHDENMFSLNDEDWDEDVDDDEVPKPTFDEVQLMKQETISSLTNKHMNLMDLINSTNARCLVLDNAIEQLKSCKDLNTIIQMCETYQNLICE